MSTVGPELPPHLLAKRKRQQEEEDKEAERTASGAKRHKSQSPEQKPTRQVGPAPPPAPLEERPTNPPDDSEDSDSSDDDGFGPALPTAQDRSTTSAFEDRQVSSANAKATATTTQKAQRDEWMTMPPTQDNLAARLDPTRPRPRGFNTGKGASAPVGGDGSSWTETPEQKQKRLADQVMGIAPEAKTSTTGSDKMDARQRAKLEEDRERAAQIKASRGSSLYDMHQQKEGKVQEDDPSQRAFDREKDMSLGGVSGKQRREMVGKAAGFGSKFSGGSFL